MNNGYIKKFLPLIGAASLLFATALPATAGFKFAVYLDGASTDGGNAIPTVIDNNFGAGAATLISASNLETPGFLANFDTLIISRYAANFGQSNFSLAEISNIQNYVGLANSPTQGGVAVFTNDAADTFQGSGVGDPTDFYTTQLFINAATYAATSGHGYIGEFNGAALAFQSNLNGSSLGLLEGSAGGLEFQSIGQFVYIAGPVGSGNPIDGGIIFPINVSETSTFGFTVTGANPGNIVDVYSAPGSQYNNTPAVVANSFVISGGGSGSSGNLTPVPESSTYGMMGALGLVGLIVRRRFSAKKAAA